MVAPARLAALSVVRAVSDVRGDLGDALRRAKETLGDERDRALAAEIALGTLRHRAALDYQVSQRVSRAMSRMDAEVVDILRVGAFQLLHLTRVPPAAIVTDAVAQTRSAGKSSAAGLVNAVLRRLARERDALTWPDRPVRVDTDADRRLLVEHLAVVHSHPAWLVERWIERYGLESTEAWLVFDNAPPALTLAVNLRRATRGEVQAQLSAEGVETTPTRDSPVGLIVDRGRALDTAAFRDGLVLVQDEASQIVATLAAADAAERVLDACAAPGGKTVALASQIGAAGVVVACDVRARRIRLLANTLRRARVSHTWPVHVASDGTWPFRTGTFDRVLVDAPCSGLGTVRRDPDIRWRRELGDLRRFAETQVALLNGLAPLVAPRGRMIYSTCSSEPEENEDVVSRFLGTHPEFSVRPLSTIEGLPSSVVAMATGHGFLRTFPYRDGLEAFFGVVMERGI